MLAKRQTTTGNPKANKYGHSSIFISPVVTQVPPGYIFYSGKSEFPVLTFLERSFRYLMLVGSRTGGWEQCGTSIQPKTASSVSLDFPLRSPTEKPEKKRNKLQLLTDWARSDAETRLLVRCYDQLEVIFSSLEKVRVITNRAEEGNEDLSQRGKKNIQRINLHMEDHFCHEKEKSILKCVRI